MWLQVDEAFVQIYKVYVARFTIAFLKLLCVCVCVQNLTSSGLLSEIAANKYVTLRPRHGSEGNLRSLSNQPLERERQRSANSQLFSVHPPLTYNHLPHSPAHLTKLKASRRRSGSTVVGVKLWPLLLYCQECFTLNPPEGCLHIRIYDIIFIQNGHFKIVWWAEFP